MGLIDLKTNLAKEIKYNREDLKQSRASNADDNYKKFKPDDDQLIKRDIGEGYRGADADGGLLRGGAALQAERTAEDTERIGKFLTTPKGALFTVKQATLQAFNGDKRTNIYNPTSVLQSLPNNISEQRHIEKEQGVGGFLKGLIGIGNNTKYEDSQRIKDDINKRGGNKNATKFFNVKDRGDRKLQVKYEGDELITKGLDVLNSKGEPLPEDFIKFRIRDVVNGKYIIFPALLSGITDNSSQQPSEITYLGRPDKVFVYGTTDRTIGFSLNVVALNETDIPIIWEKINYLKGLVHPQYKEFQNDSGQNIGLGTRPVAPFVYLTLGDLFHDTPGFFNSVNLTIPDNSSWELKDGRQFPHVCTITFDFKYIGKQTPTMQSKQFEGEVGRTVDRDAGIRQAIAGGIKLKEFDPDIGKSVDVVDEKRIKEYQDFLNAAKTQGDNVGTSVGADTGKQAL